ncbi:S41 family peptidase [Nitrospirillum pindoramense]|uniref:Uncharacterized protein n=1 Tax=Nitrospirillum amazonense TaxID=28077 RepID=A0A560GMF0_9PROT|nr:S41 family peptidase [Nitrospirillum amazonense]TWB35165.1 hypothetical protein FBZ90_12114 [Nitrospirillum amazonense]
MPRLRLLLILFLLMICLPAMAERRGDYPPKPTTVQGWRKAAAEDLAAIHTLLKKNHPAMVVDKGGESFKAWIDKGYEQAKRQIPDIRGEWDYYFLITHYVGGFRDAHIRINRNAKYRYSDLQRWPGIILAYVDSHYVVRNVAPWLGERGPPVGAVLVTCDGYPVDALARARLDAYFDNLDLEGGRYRTAPLLLLDLGNTYAPLPRACWFKGQSGGRMYPLEYRAPPPENDLQAEINAAAGYGPAPPLGLSQPAPGLWWITLSSMAPSGENWNAFLAEIKAHLADIRAAHQVVIDLRANWGGSDLVPQRLASLLWGDDFFSSHQPASGRALYRVTPLVVGKYREMERQSAGVYAAATPETGSQMGMILQRALDHGKPSHTFMNGLGRTGDAIAPADPIAGQVILLTDYACVSACLDGVDMMLPMPNTILAGRDTGADTIFGSIIRTPLPSLRWSLYFSVNAAIDRCRGNNIPYRPLPGFRFRGDITDTAAVQAWVQHLPPTPADWGATGPGCPRSQPQPPHPPPSIIMD